MESKVVEESSLVPEHLYLSEPKDQVTVFFDHDDTPLNIAVLNDSIERKVPLESVLGVSFELRCELMRDHIDGKFVIVQKQENYETRFWRKWIRVFLRVILYFISAFYLFGLFTAIISSIMCTLLMLYLLRRRISKMKVPAELEDDEIGQKNVSMQQITLPKRLTIILSGNILSAMMMVYLQFLKRFEFFDPYLSFVNTTSAPVICVLATISLYALFSFFPLPIGISKYFYRFLIARMVLPSPPSPRYPIVVTYDEDNVKQLIKLRKQFYQSPVLRSLVRDYWIGPAALEAGFIYALPSAVYNSIGFRKSMFVIVNYVIPFYSVIRGVGALAPHLTSLSSLLSTDIGLNFIKEIADFYLRRLGVLVITAVRLVGEHVPLYTRLTTLLTKLVNPLRTTLEPAINVILKGFYMLNRLVFSYLIPNNIYFQYLQNRLTLLQYTFEQILKQGSNAMYFLFSGVSNILGQITSFMHIYLTKPLPAPNVALVAKNVVQGGMDLAQAIATTPPENRTSYSSAPNSRSPLSASTSCLPDMVMSKDSAGQRKSSAALTMRDRKAGAKKAADARLSQSCSDLRGGGYTSGTEEIRVPSSPLVEVEVEVEVNSEDEFADDSPGLLEDAQALMRGETLPNRSKEYLQQLARFNELVKAHPSAATSTSAVAVAASKTGKSLGSAVRRRQTSFSDEDTKISPLSSISEGKGSSTSRNPKKRKSLKNKRPPLSSADTMSSVEETSEKEKEDYQTQSSMKDKDFQIKGKHEVDFVSCNLEDTLKHEKVCELSNCASTAGHSSIDDMHNDEF